MKESKFNIWVEREDYDYLFGGMSGGLLRVSKRDHDTLGRFLDGLTEECPVPLIERLLDGRMLVADEADELHLLERRYEHSRGDRSQLALTIVTSLGCNFNCPYCFEAKEPSLLDRKVERAIRGIVAEQAATIDSLHVTWYGGEPLLGRRQLLALSDEFMSVCDIHGVSYRADIVTNGHLLTDDTCRDLAKRGVRSAQVTIDGPPDVHNRMRPLASGGPTFAKIVSNLHHAVRHLQVSVRVKLDGANVASYGELLQILADEGFAGKLDVYPAQLTKVDDGVPAPSASYPAECLSCRTFADVEGEFQELAQNFGFHRPHLPSPVGAPCTAVRGNELVVGSRGELYKCWDSVGNSAETIGNVSDWRNQNTRVAKWRDFDPFADSECRNCIALPVCMGGCAHHAMDPNLYDSRCSTFRWTYAQQIERFVEDAEARTQRGEATVVAEREVAIDTR